MVERGVGAEARVPPKAREREGCEGPVLTDGVRGDVGWLDLLAAELTDKRESTLSRSDLDLE
jgi:hypothetical protein